MTLHLPLLELQQAVYGRLSGLLDTPVYDAVPAGTAPPYLTLGEASVTDWSTKSSAGCEIILRLHVWSAYAGMSEAAGIMDAVSGALTGNPLVVAGYAVSLLRPVEHRLERDANGLRHGVLEFCFAVQGI